MDAVSLCHKRVDAVQVDRFKCFPLEKLFQQDASRDRIPSNSPRFRQGQFDQKASPRQPRVLAEKAGNSSGDYTLMICRILKTAEHDEYLGVRKAMFHPRSEASLPNR